MTHHTMPDFPLSSRLAYEYDAKCSNVQSLLANPESLRKYGFHELTGTAPDERAHGAARILLEITGCDQDLIANATFVEGALMISRRLNSAAYRLGNRALATAGASDTA